MRFIRPKVVMGTILLVDDHPLRAAMRRSLLETNAPLVVRAQDAGEALCMVESPEFAEGLSLVVTGHQLSGITGPEFVAEFRSRMPDVPVLVLSTVEGADAEYAEIPDVIYSETRSADELRAIVKQLTATNEKRTA